MSIACFRYVSLFFNIYIIILFSLGYVAKCEATNVRVMYNDDNTNSFPLFYFRNIGVKLCLKMCEKYSECDRVYFDREQMQCELRRTLSKIDWNSQILAGRFTSLVNLHLRGGLKSFEVSRNCCFETSIDSNIETANFSSIYQNEREKLDEFQLHSKTCWAVNKSDPNPYISVIFEEDFWVTAVVTQGRADVSQWVTSYNVATLSKENTWIFQHYEIHVLSNIIKLFRGNNDRNSLVERKFNIPVYTRGLRLYPKGYQGYRSMRLGVKGFRNSIAKTGDIDD